MSERVLSESVSFFASNWLSDYGLAVEALGSLGFNRRDDGVPTWEAICASLRPAIATLLNTRRLGGVPDCLLITPSLQRIGLEGTQDKPGLVMRFNKRQGSSKYDQAYVWPPLWKQIEDKDPRHGGGVTDQPFSVDILLGSAANVTGIEESTSDHGEPGLLYTRQDIWQQRVKLAAELVRQRQFGYDLRAATIGNLIVAQAIERSNGFGPMLDEATQTRLPQYGEYVVEGVCYVPRVCWTKANVPASGDNDAYERSALSLGGSLATLELDFIGIRQVIHVDV